jgi:hypothetical protein
MSLSLIRQAFEKRLSLLSPALSTAHENVQFTPLPGTPYQRVNLLPAAPDNSIQGGASYFERGLFQITLCYPQGVGAGAAEAQSQLLRTHFKRGSALLESGLTITVIETPKVAPARLEGDRYEIPISVAFQALTAT